MVQIPSLWQFLTKLDTHLPYDPEILLSEKKRNALVYQKTCTKMFIFIIAKMRNNPNVHQKENGWGSWGIVIQ